MLELSLLVLEGVQVELEDVELSGREGEEDSCEVRRLVVLVRGVNAPRR